MRQNLSVLAALAVLMGLSLPALGQLSPPLTFSVDLTGASETPPNGSPGTGEATVSFFENSSDLVALTVSGTYSNLLGGATSAALSEINGGGEDGQVIISMTL